MRSANTLDITGHITKLEMIHKISEGDINAIVRPTVLFSHTNELKTPDLVDADTNPDENLQDNGALPPLGTQSSLLHSPL